MSRDNSISEEEFVKQANDAFNDKFCCKDVLEACEEFYGNGAADQVSGDVEIFYHFYRVHRWIVTADSQGFHELETYDNEAEAIEAFKNHETEYSALFAPEPRSYIYRGIE